MTADDSVSSTAIDHFLQLLVKELPAAVSVCNAQGQIVAFNAAARQLWGRIPRVPSAFFDTARNTFSGNAADWLRFQLHFRTSR